MIQSIAQVTLLVDDYDEAIAFYTQKLGFTLIEDNKLSETKRWVVVAPNNAAGCKLLLAKASNAEQKSRVGSQTGDRVSLFLYTDDFNNYHRHLLVNNVKIIREPVEAPYGIVMVFADLYGNLWDLIEPVDQK
jgi:catechol 2,3-dioxygenase-like lactoylglutathione lyase family enzyme